MQLYLYDLSEFTGSALDVDGRFAYQYLDAYWSEPGRRAFLARISGRPGGFALVNEHSVLSPEASGVRTIAEFFVLRPFRRVGLGSALALDVFRRFPGRWEVRQEHANEPAQFFWRKVIGEYTAGRFVELYLADHRWRGPVQTFDNSLMVG
jgi:predicted acetyltransferase